MSPDAAQRALFEVVTRHPIVEPSDLDRLDATHVRLGDRFVAHSPRDLARRLAVYAHGYLMRIVEVLEQEFEATSKLMGEEAFRECVWRYLRRHPSRNANLRWVGREFADYLADYLPGSVDRRAPGVPASWPVEMARLEWARSLAFDAEQDRVADFGELTRTPPHEWGSLKLRPVASLSCVHSRFDVVSTWHRLANGAPVEPPDAASTAAATSRRETCVWRRHGDVVHQSLSDDESQDLSLLRSSESLADFCARLAEDRALDEAETARRALGRLRDWTARGWLAFN